MSSTTDMMQEEAQPEPTGLGGVLSAVEKIFHQGA